MIYSGTEIQGLKWGSLARHIPNMHTYRSTPPPPPPHRAQDEDDEKEEVGEERIKERKVEKV